MKKSQWLIYEQQDVYSHFSSMSVWNMDPGHRDKIPYYKPSCFMKWLCSPNFISFLIEILHNDWIFVLN